MRKIVLVGAACVVVLVGVVLIDSGADDKGQHNDAFAGINTPCPSRHR